MICSCSWIRIHLAETHQCCHSQTHSEIAGTEGFLQLTSPHLCFSLLVELRTQIFAVLLEEYLLIDAGCKTSWIVRWEIFSFNLIVCWMLFLHPAMPSVGINSISLVSSWTKSPLHNISVPVSGPSNSEFAYLNKIQVSCSEKSPLNFHEEK